MKNGVFSKDDECWSIAESIVEEIEAMQSKGTGRLSKDDGRKDSIKGLLMKSVRWPR